MKRVLSLLLVLFLSANTSALVKVNGAGASFPYPIYSKWFSEYKKVATDTEFNYQAIGSGGGIRQLIKQTVDFGASDAPMKEKDIKKAAWPVKHIPTVLGAVAVAYNLEIGDVKLDGQTLADIFMGKISKWNHPSIAKLNKGLSLPAQDILVVRRADGSGTTAIFSDYLSTISPSWEKNIGRGKSLKWPSGIGAKGNDGVTAIIKQTQGAIGYIELAYALKNNINTVALKNDAGEFVKPSVKGVSLSADTLKGKDSKVTVSIVNAKGKGVYPISAFTYILLPVKEETQQLKEVKKFLKWALTDGQNMATDLHYAPLPKSLAKRMLKEL
ncbi:phosphate ABC transporter substrate-binding protein PstS [Halobacteriovorax sp. HLS]|uniref:phosphate ABC transporter substrate-binding protein PstS n=1 Tax=Halobacteriovorax sp. HLS TaxID=2234000 RepID=UPI000FD88BDF|nr:phosphate ABC transporter substrate-binding protein PstS [Halobacteriovorax sp. HLS]